MFQQTIFLTGAKILASVGMLVMSSFIIMNTASGEGVRLTTSTRASETCTWEKKGEYCDENKKEIYATIAKKCNGQWTSEEKYEGTGKSCGDSGGSTGGCTWEKKGEYCDQAKQEIWATIAKKCDGQWTSEEKYESTGKRCDGSPITVPTATPVPGAEIPGDWPAGKNCRYQGSGCVSADFRGTNANNPPEGKMWCCKNAVDGPGGYRYGTAEPCDPGTCGGDCNRHPEGGVHSDTTCGNPYRCPVRTTPPPNQPSPTPQECKDVSKGFYCDTWSTGDNYCKRFETMGDTCGGADRYRNTGQNCCPPPGEPTEPPPPTSTPRPRQPNEPTPTTPPPPPPGTCTQLTVTLEKGGSVDVNSAGANNVLPRLPDPGEKVTVTSRAGEQARFAGYWIRPVGSPNNYNPATKSYDQASTCSFWLPLSDSKTTANGSIVTFVMPDWKSGQIFRNDPHGAQNNCNQVPLDFSQGVIFGVIYLQPQNTWTGNTWCRNIGPATNAGLLHNGSENLGQACDNFCVATSNPPGPTTTPSPTPQPGKQVCGYTPCDNATAPCADGLECIETSGGAKYCSKPELKTACAANPSQTSCCTEPTRPPQEVTNTPTPTPVPARCGYTPCDDVTAPCGDGMICLETSTGAKYCSMPEFEEACYDNPNQTTCCTAPSPTPTPTPKPLKCGETPCNDTSAPCEDGMICVQAANGSRYCSMPEYQDACRTSPSRTSCCTAPTPTPQPTYTPVPTYTPLPTYTPVPPPPERVVVQDREVQVPVVTTIIQQVPVVQQQQQVVQPTYTPLPPPPTYTPLPTYTPFPSQPPQPTYTPAAIPVAGNPIPWVVVGTPLVLMLLGMLL